MVGWFLDINALLSEETFIEMEVPNSGAVPRTMAEVRDACS